MSRRKDEEVVGIWPKHRWSPRESVPVVCEGGRTQQEFKDECDINLIMKDALRTGTIRSRSDMARYGDFSAGIDYREAQDVLIAAQSQFASLPSELRDRFKNDPAKFLDWIHDSKTDLEEVQKYGMLSEEGKRKIEERKRAKNVPAGESK